MAFATAGSVTLPRDDFERLVALAEKPPIVPGAEGLVGFDAEGCGPYVPPPTSEDDGPYLYYLWEHDLTLDDERLLNRCRDVLR